jgi:hypothetical protein
MLGKSVWAFFLLFDIAYAALQHICSQQRKIAG